MKEPVCGVLFMAGEGAFFDGVFCLSGPRFLDDDACDEGWVVGYRFIQWMFPYFV
jgi:hypothetical protein